MIHLKPKQTFCIPEHLLKDGWMFLQHWATFWSRWPSVGQTISAAGVSRPCPYYKTAISGCFDLTAQDVGICGVTCCILVTCQFTWQYRTWKYNYFTLFRCFEIVFFYFFYFWSVGYIALYKLHFQNWQICKCLITRGPFKGEDQIFLLLDKREVIERVLLIVWSF